MLTRNKLYIILSVACLAGYIWLYLNFINSGLQNGDIEVCLFKKVTSIPCPSCGSTRSVQSILTGAFQDALLINPLGYIVAVIMLIAPLWITLDLVTKSNSLFSFYTKLEIQLKKPRLAIPLIALVMINWIWNIVKDL